MADEREQRQQRRQGHPPEDRGDVCAQARLRIASPALAPALAALIDSSALGIALLDIHGNLLWVNRAFEAMTGDDGPLRIEAGARLHLASRSSDAKLQAMIAAGTRGETGAKTGTSRQSDLVRLLGSGLARLNLVSEMQRKRAPDLGSSGGRGSLPQRGTAMSATLAFGSFRSSAGARRALLVRFPPPMMTRGRSITSASM
jgi:PAS domain-containing protein